MADVQLWLPKVRKNEAGYANVAGDRGGVTYAGITYKNYPDWEGWPVVFSKERKHNEKIPELNTLVDEFYVREFWNKLQLDKAASQELAEQIADAAVMSSHKAAIKFAQNIFGLEQTGKLCEDTLQHLQGLA
ncbi:MAG: hypothetical protein KF744_08945 [Taibaiella sp.]|nr:hypothetical protein [Taibaiella sp.]